MTTSANNMAAASAILLEAGQAVIDSVKNQAQQAAGDAENSRAYYFTSNLFPCVCVAMYETILSPQMFEDDLNEGEEEFNYCTVSLEDWDSELIKVAQEYINDSVIERLKNYGLINIEATDIWHPKYYNYHNDELLMTITMQQDWQSIMAEKVAEWQNNAAVKEYISKYYHSYDGYVNFMPESLAEVLTEDNIDRQLAAFLTLAMVAEGMELNCNNIMEELHYRMEDFSDYKRLNVIEEYLGSEYQAEELLKLWNDDWEWNNLYWTLVEKKGWIWRQPETRSLHGKEDYAYSWDADSDGKRLLFWAAQNGYTVNDLKAMAA